MATLNTTYTFTNGNVAEAGQVNTNFNDVESWVSTNVVQIDGSVQAPTIAIADGAITSAKILNGTIVAEDIADGAITSAKILDGTIVNGDVNASAAIAYSKLALSNSIIAGDITAAAVTNAKLNNGVSGDIPLVTVSASAATGGKNGDVWIVV